MVIMGKKTINADFEILLHPDLVLEISGVTLWYTVGKNWDDYYANKINKKYQLTIYDLPEEGMMEFYIEISLKDGRVMKASKGGDNYKVKLVDKGGGVYKAQVRVKELNFSYRQCLICESKIPSPGIQCETKECEATYCPNCNRILPPHSNYCPWDQKLIN